MLDSENIPNAGPLITTMALLSVSEFGANFLTVSVSVLSDGGFIVSDALFLSSTGISLLMATIGLLSLQLVLNNAFDSPGRDDRFPSPRIVWLVLTGCLCLALTVVFGLALFRENDLTLAFEKLAHKPLTYGLGFWGTSMIVVSIFRFALGAYMSRLLRLFLSAVWIASVLLTVGAMLFETPFDAWFRGPTSTIVLFSVLFLCRLLVIVFVLKTCIWPSGSREQLVSQ